MIVTRAPFRASFFGGGSDLPSFYRTYGGATLSIGIDQHMFLTGRRMFDPSQTLLKYSKTEMVQDIDSIEHPIFREALGYFGVTGLDIGVSSDVPAGTGLGSSSTFTVALVNLLAELEGRYMSPRQIAELACKIELEMLGEPIGKQDQYASALGGMNLFVFNEDDSVDVHPLHLSPEELRKLSTSLYLAQVPMPSRSASAVLSDMTSFQSKNEQALAATRQLSELAVAGYREIKEVGVAAIPELLNHAWLLKRRSNPEPATDIAVGLIEEGLDSGALAGKLLGAGGGGFVLFWVPPENFETFKSRMGHIRILKIRPDLSGVTTIYKED